MLWLADKLANIRSLARMYSEIGEGLWQKLNQKDSSMHRWYYKSIAENLELSLNRTGAFKEFIRHINSIWPGAFDSRKARYRKYHEASVEGCKIIAALLSYIRLINRIHSKGALSDRDREQIDRCLEKITGLTEKTGSLVPHCL